MGYYFVYFVDAKRIERTHDLQAANRYTLYPLHPSPNLRRMRYAALCNLYLYTAIGACAAMSPPRGQEIRFLSDF